MSEVEDLIKYLNDFRKRPILVEQEAQIVCAMIDGSINKNTAKELFKCVIEQNLKKYNEIVSMDEKQILELIDNVG